MVDDGDGGPVLVVLPDRPGFGRYLAEILRAEGIGAFAVAPVARLSQEVLARHDLILLAPGAIDAATVALIEARVQDGAGLIAVGPDPRLGPVLGVEVGPDVVDEGYLQVLPPLGDHGISGRSMQVHAPASTLRPVEATAVAVLLDGQRRPTGGAAVTVRRAADGRGAAVAFAYDLARSVVGTRQGNPAWAGQNRDGDLAVRSNDLFYGGDATDPQPDWVDADLLDLPQADEQQRLLVHLLHLANPGVPIAQAWYLPDGARAAVVLTGDDHGSTGMVTRFDELADLDGSEARIGAWDRVRATSYTVPDTLLTDADARRLHRAGFEIALHATVYENRFTAASLHRDLTRELRAFRSRFPSLPAPVTHRTHSVPWSDWSSQAEVEAAHGIRMDANYYWFPAPWVADRPALFTGSGLPMRFARATGEVIDCFQLVTQLTDEAKQTYPSTIDALLDRCSAPNGPVAVLTANMHTDLAGSNGSDAIVAAARRRGVPVVSARQVLTWLDARAGSTLAASRTGAVTTLEVDLHPSATGLVAMVPLAAGDGGTASVTVDGRPVDFWHQDHAGHRYVAFEAVAGAVTITLAATTEEPTGAPDPPEPVVVDGDPGAKAIVVHRSLTDFDSGVREGTALSRSRGGSVVLAAHVPLEVGADGALPPGWRAVPGSGGVVSDGEGVRIVGTSVTAADHLEPGSTFEVEVVLSGVEGERIGLTGPAGAQAVLRTNASGRLALVAGTGAGEHSVPVPGRWAGSPHRLRVLWQPGLIAAFVDGWPVAELRMRVPAPLHPSVAAAPSGEGLVVRWGRASPFPATGSFTSAVVDAGRTVTWTDAGIVAPAESMTAARIFVRVGPTAAPDDTWSPYLSPAPAAGPLGLVGRYAQYRLELSTSWHVTPEVEQVELGWSAG